MNMSESISVIPDRQPVAPQWSISPREYEHADPHALPFDMLHIPDAPQVIPLSDVYINANCVLRKTDNLTLEHQITRRASARQQESQLSSGIKLFDGRISRLHPQDIEYTDKAHINIRLGETTYFTYVGTRGKESLRKYGYDRLGLPLGVCSIVTTPSTDGSTKILYTKRGVVNETYAGWYHGVGGTVQTFDGGIVDPTNALRKEIFEELGLDTSACRVSGVLGIVMNTVDVHPELVYASQTKDFIETWLPHTHTDKEGEIGYFTDTAENLEAFVLGKSFSDVPDARPIVPSGLAGYLLYGRVKYGRGWYDRVFRQIPQY